MFNLQDIIQDLIKTDDSYNINCDRNIIGVYNNSNDDVKTTIDVIFISLCGYSLRTIIEDIYSKTQTKD
jgi:hypothetical protein